MIVLILTILRYKYLRISPLLIELCLIRSLEIRHLFSQPISKVQELQMYTVINKACWGKSKVLHR